MDKPIIYFLCTGNSCRSQMAEGFGKHYLGEQYEIHSAGIEAHGVNPKAVKAMEEVGIDISAQSSTLINSALLNKADHVITLCGDANEKCPMTQAHVKRAHWGFDDPAKAVGTEKEKWAVFQRIRDELGTRIQRFAKNGE